MDEQVNSAPLDAPRSYRRLGVQFTLCFLLLSALCFFWFYLTGQTNIWREDGMWQHYPALRWYVSTLRGAIRGLFAGQGLHVSEWSFALGEGNDVLTALHYYVLGDPVNLLALLCPTRYLYVAYALLTHLRMYLAGLAFLWLLRQTGKKPDIGLLIATLIYVFSYWGLRNAVRHPYFLNPMIYLPLLVGCVERVLRGKSVAGLALTVCLAGLSNFYFFFVLGVLTALYSLIRVVPTLRKDPKSGIRALGKLVGTALLGTAMAAVILVPVIRSFLSDTRFGADRSHPLLYPLGYYAKLPEMLMAPTSRYWLCVGTAAPALIGCLLLLLRRREHRLLCFLMGLCLLFCLFPIFGQALNGFSYLCNRWSFAFVLVISFGFAEAWPELTSLDRKTARRLAIGLTVYLALGMVLNVRAVPTMLPVLLLNAATLALLWPRKKLLAWAPRLILLLTVVNIAVNAAYRFVILSDDNASRMISVDDLSQSNETDLIRAAAEEVGDDWIRYSGRALTVNAGLNADLSSTRYYWSLTNPGVNRFRRMMGVNEIKASASIGYDDRTPLLALTSVNWYAVPKKDKNDFPMDCEIAAKTDKWTVARNQTTLPLTYVYDSWTTEDTLEPLSYSERQELLLRTAVLDAPVTGLPEWKGSLETTQLQASLWTDDPEVTIQDGRFVVTKDAAHAYLSFQGEPNSETLLEWQGLNFRKTTEYELYCGGDAVDPKDLYPRSDFDARPLLTRFRLWSSNRFGAADDNTFLTFKTSAKRSTAINYFTPDFNFYNGIHEFAQNLGDNEEALTEVRISFYEPGVFTFDSLKLYAQPLDSIRALLDARRSAGLTNQKVTDDFVSGEITLDEPKLLVFSIPVSDGWSATVDGAPAELHTANLKNMALLLEPGTHSIALRYERPAGRLGLWISLAAWAILLLLTIRYRTKKT